MNAPAKRRSKAPDVDEGDEPNLIALLRSELRPTPGRLGDSVRVVVVVLGVVAVAETFRIPDVALSALLVLLLSGRDAVSTVQTALLSGIAAFLGIVATLGFFILSLSEPAVRIPLMAVLTFATMFLARASPMGPLFFAAGFIVAYGLTLGDEVLGLALQPATVGNGPQFELPEIFFMPPAEALLHFILWMGLAVLLPVLMVIAANILTGRDPLILLRRALGDRLTAAGSFCAGERGAESRLEAQALEGTAGLRKWHRQAGVLPGGRRRPAYEPLIDDIAGLGLLLLAWRRVEGSGRSLLLPAAVACRQAERALQNPEVAIAEPVSIAASGAARPLAEAISRTLRAIRGAFAGEASEPEEHGAAPSPQGLLVADAFSNPDYVRFALKVTLAVMICYFVQNLADWPGIHTCVITCYFIALGTVGETLNKATLRIIGCLIGAGLGLGAILLLMPLMTNLGDLLLLLAPVTLLAAWLTYGSDRISYAGLQVGIAFYLVVLQGYGPTIDMDTARDRVIGILFGNVVTFVVFTTIWPVSVTNVARTNLARGLEQLATLVALAGTDGEISQASRSAAAKAFGQAIAQARASLIKAPFESLAVRRAGRQRLIDVAVVTQVGRLFIPVSVILDLRGDRVWHELPKPIRDAIGAHHRALTAWFRQTASWVRTGEGAAEVFSGVPEAPLLSAEGDYLAILATWYGLLRQDIREILDRVGPPQPPTKAASVAGALHAAG